MKQLLPIIFLICAIYLIPTYCQNARQDEIRALHLQIPPLVAGQKFDELVPIAERIVKLEKDGGEANVTNYFFALQNLTRWSDRRLDINRYGTKSWAKNHREEMQKVIDLYGEVLALAQRVGTPLQLATVQFDGASFIRRKRLSAQAAIDLYQSALAIRVKHLPPDADVTLLTIEKLSEIYFAQGDFEKFLPLNRHLVEALGKKPEKDARTVLVSSLTLYARFLAMIDRETEAEEIDKKIASFNELLFEPTRDTSPLLNRGLSEMYLEFGSVPGSRMSGGAISIPNPTTIRMQEESITFRGGSVVNVPRHTVADQMRVPQPILVDNRERRVQDIVVGILIDEKGNVVEVIPETPKKQWAKKIIDRVMKWKFKPFAYDGMPTKLRGKFTINYFH